MKGKEVEAGMGYLKVYNKSSIGRIFIVSDGEAVTGLWIHGQRKDEETFIKSMVQKKIPVLQNAEKWLDLYFNGQNPPIDFPIKLEGSDFQKCVWDELEKIDYAETTTYGEIAKKVAKRLGKEKMSAQAVGGAVGSNPVSIMIPCHRVIGKNGNLTGYAGGINLKIFLLELEGVL